MRAIAAPPGGWAAFVERYWEKSPVLFRGAFDASFCDAQRALRVLVRGALRAARGEARARVYLDRGRLDRPADWMPCVTDASFDVYASRVSAARRGRDLTVVLNGATGLDATLYRRCRRFLRGLDAHAKVSMHNDAVVYASIAGASTFGVHKDPDANFLFVVHGHKRFRVWEPASLTRRPDRVRSQDHADIDAESLVFDVGPGDLLYIPTGLYHVAEGSDGVCVHVGVLVSDDPVKPFELVMAAASAIVRARVGPRAPSCRLRLRAPRSAGGTLELPVALSKLRDAFVDLEAPLVSAVDEAWAKRWSAFGFRDVPPMRSHAVADRALRDEVVVRAVKGSGLVLVRSNGRALVAANGHATRLPAHPRLISLVRSLRSGQAKTVALWAASVRGSSLVDGERVRVGPREGRALLVLLFRMRALRVVTRVAVGSSMMRRPLTPPSPSR